MKPATEDQVTKYERDGIAPSGMSNLLWADSLIARVRQEQAEVKRLHDIARDALDAGESSGGSEPERVHDDLAEAVINFLYVCGDPEILTVALIRHGRTESSGEVEDD